MPSITFPDLLTTIYVLVDDWYQAYGLRFLQGKPGSKPDFSDSEVLTLLLAMDYLPFPGETQFLGYLRANYRALFPKLVVSQLEIDGYTRSSLTRASQDVKRQSTMA